MVSLNVYLWVKWEIFACLFHRTYVFIQKYKEVAADNRLSPAILDQKRLLTTGIH